MVDDIELPFTTNLPLVVATFIVSLVLFHLLLVRWKPLDKADWKRTDYFWLTLVLLGTLSAVVSARQEAASLVASTAESRLQFAAEQVEEVLAFGQGPAICVKFVYSPMSPPREQFDQNQREADEQCAWFRAVAERLPSTQFGKRGALEAEDIGLPPAGGARSATEWFLSAVQGYNEAVDKVREIAEARSFTPLELPLKIVGPFLLAIGVALRFTKVTGELKLEGGST